MRFKLHTYLHIPTHTITYLHIPTHTYAYLRIPTHSYIYLNIPTHISKHPADTGSSRHREWLARKRKIKGRNIQQQTNNNNSNGKTIPTYHWLSTKNIFNRQAQNHCEEEEEEKEEEEEEEEEKKKKKKKKTKKKKRGRRRRRKRRRKGWRRRRRRNTTRTTTLAKSNKQTNKKSKQANTYNNNNLQFYLGTQNKDKHSKQIIMARAKRRLDKLIHDVLLKDTQIGFRTRLEYLDCITCLRYTPLVRDPTTLILFFFFLFFYSSH